MEPGPSTAALLAENSAVYEGSCQQEEDLQELPPAESGTS